MTIRQEEKSIIDEFSMFTDWMDKYEYIIELGKNLPIIEAKEKVDSNLIKGCQSRVWLQCNYSDRKLFFKADSDAIITKGIISLLIRVYSGHTPQEILDSDVSFIDEIGLKENLSPTRANGLVSMIKQIHLYALAYREQEKQS
jgi:cysteine desulfuration protein SufE